MSKLSPILTQYTIILRRKTIAQLKQQLQQLGYSAGRSRKQEIIQYIITYMQDDQVHMNRVAKQIEDTNNKANSSAITVLKQKNPSNQPQPYYNFQHLSSMYNKSKLAHIALLQQKITQKYCKTYANTKLSQLLRNQLIPYSREFYRDAKAQMIEDAHRMELEKFILKEERIKERSMKIGTEEYKQNQRIYIIDDLKNTNEEMQAKNREKRMLNQLGIQTQIIYPDYLITRYHQNRASQILKILRNEDTSSINRYIRDNLPPHVRKFTKKRQIRNKVKKLSEALEFMELIKQYEYSCAENLQRLLENHKKETWATELGDFLKRYDRYVDFYDLLLPSIGRDGQLKLTNKIIQICGDYIVLGQLMQKTQSNFLVRIISFAMKVLVFASQSQQKPKESIVLTKLAQQLTEKWVKTCSNKQLYNAQDLSLFLQGIKHFNELSALFSVFSQSTQNDFQNILKEAAYSVQSILQTTSQSSPIIAPALMNSIIVNIQQIFNEEDITEGTIANCLIHACSLINELKMETRKSLIRLLGGPSVIGKKIVSGDKVGLLFSHLTGLEIKQVLLAIQLISNYQIPNQDRLICQLIKINIDPAFLDTNIQEYLNKIVSKRLKNQSLKDELVRYIQGQN